MIQYRERAWAEISLDALEYNVKVIQNQLAHTTEYCAVVKADAYGHGEEYICKKLYKMGIGFYAVSSFEEAVRVRRWCPEGEILILGYTAPECAPMLAEQKIIQAVVSVEYARELSKSAKINAPVRCHIALDTGMGRIGIKTGSENSEKEACLQELKEISALQGVQIEGLFTHFAVADEENAENVAYTEKQQAEFFYTAEMYQKEIGKLKHIIPFCFLLIIYHYSKLSS